MTLGDEMVNLSLSSFPRQQDPVAEATKKGKVPTLGEVKRSLKVHGSTSSLNEVTQITPRLSSKISYKPRHRWTHCRVCLHGSVFYPCLRASHCF